MSRRRALVVAGLGVLALAVGVVVAVSGGDDRDEPAVLSPGQGATGCRAPEGGTPAPASDPALPRPATINLPGARSVDTGGLAPDAVAEAGDGNAWAIVRDARSVQQPVGRIARVNADAGSFAQLVDVVAGCDVAALGADESSVWAGTCDALATDATAGAELVEIGPGDGAIRRRIEIPTACAADVVPAGSRVWVTSVGTIDAPARIFRVDVASGAVDEPLTVDASESLLGLAADAEVVWTARRGTTGARLVRSDAATGAEVVVVPAASSRVLGIIGGTLWTQDLDASAIVGRDARSGEPTATAPVTGLQLAAASGTTVWYESAGRDSLAVTVGRIDAAGGASTALTYTGAGPDRTGLPFVGTLTATRRGAWLALQDRLFLVGA